MLIYIIRDTLELTYESKKIMILTSILFFRFIFILEKERLR